MIERTKAALMRGRSHSRRRSTGAAVFGALAVLALLPARPTAAAGGLPQGDPGTPHYMMGAGAVPLNTSRTIPYWHGQFTDPTNGVTYGYNMVGADPSTETTTVIPVDIVPLNFTFASANGYALNGSDVVARTLASPIFQSGDYSTTPAVTGPVDGADQIPVLPGGELSAGNTNVQYEDAIMRSQFNKTGTSYHLILQPTVWPAVTVNVPASLGAVFQNRRGVVWGMQNDNKSFDAVMTSLHLDPTHLSILLTDNVFLGSPVSFCCAQGFHAAGLTLGYGYGQTSGLGDQPIPTWIYSAYLRPGTFNPGAFPFDRDIQALSHEVAEWGDDPFANNYIDPWAVPEASQYGCLDILEIGDPVTRVGFAMPGNTYDAGRYVDGYWHAEDEVFLPWMARQSPNTTSQPTQQPSALGGRYTFMGDLNPYPEFHRPAPGC